MGTFESLPNEIRDIIILYARYYLEERQLMTVNKSWYNIYLSLAYTAPIIDLSSKPSKFYGIADSPFHPGKYTTSITFRSFSAEPEYTQSKLYRLMMHTPHVKEVKFHQIGNVEAQDWEYFYKVLKAANTWKLRLLPDNWILESLEDKDMALIYSTYLECAQHLKHSINSLRLMKEMMSTNIDLNFLNVFTALRFLDITKGILKSVYDLDLLLQHVPQLEELEVDFVDTSFISNHDNGGIILTREYPSIKTIDFHSFVFQTDQQACVFYTNFTGLKKLHIQGIQNELTIKPEIAEKFFTMLSSLLDYDFYIHGTFIGRFDFINANCLQETHLCIRNYENMTDAVGVKKSKDFSGGMMLYYYFSDNRDVALRTLLDLGPNIQQIRFIDVAIIYIEYYLEIILSNQHKDLHSIVFDSNITQPFFRTDYVFKSSIQNISFHHRRISTDTLGDISALFTNLKVVHFKACQFDQSSNVNIIMRDTAIDQLWVSCGVLFHNLIQDNYPKRWNPDMLPLVSIRLTEEYVVRYYYTILDKGIPVVLETTATHFYLLAEATPNYEAMTKIVNVYVKSVREISLKLNNDRSKDILMVF